MTTAPFDRLRVTPVVVDWDGTVTERDSLHMALQHFLPADVFARIEAETDAALDARRMTHRAVMEYEFRALTAPLDEVVAFLVERVRVRAGFREFVAVHDPLVLSSSFHETIEPILAREGISVRLRANRAIPGPRGWQIRWTSDAACAVCDEPCKRAALPEGPFVYVGDGYSDRCAAMAAARVFARDGLALYLRRRGVPFEPFEDFFEVAARLGCRPSTSSG